jgi:hypothetical protein
VIVELQDDSISLDNVIGDIAQAILSRSAPYSKSSFQTCLALCATILAGNALVSLAEIPYIRCGLNKVVEVHLSEVHLLEIQMKCL